MIIRGRKNLKILHFWWIILKTIIFWRITCSDKSYTFYWIPNPLTQFTKKIQHQIYTCHIFTCVVPNTNAVHLFMWNTKDNFILPLKYIGIFESLKYFRFRNKECVLCSRWNWCRLLLMMTLHPSVNLQTAACSTRCRSALQMTRYMYVNAQTHTIIGAILKRAVG